MTTYSLATFSNPKDMMITNSPKKIIVLLCFALAVFVGSVECKRTPEQENIGVYVIKKGDMSVKLTNWGAGIISVIVPDKYGKLADIVLGYDSVKEYMNDTAYVGCILGRVANRIGGAKFSLNGTLYKLVANEGNNTIHGGIRGFSDVAWKVTKYVNDSVVFTYFSHDGEEGFPGDLYVEVSYTLLRNNKLDIQMKAKSPQKPTPVNLAQHTYWNIGGHNSGTVLGQKLQIFASRYTQVNSQMIPTGEILTVKNTPYNFLKSQTIETQIGNLPHGYDINYVIDGKNQNFSEKGNTGLKKIAIVIDKKTGRKMELSTNAYGVQLYTSNWLKNVVGKNGYVYQPHDGLCLETQGFPDSVNHPNFPSQIVTFDRPYFHRMLFEFSVFG